MLRPRQFTYSAVAEIAYAGRLGEPERKGGGAARDCKGWETGDRGQRRGGGGRGGKDEGVTAGSSRKLDRPERWFRGQRWMGGSRGRESSAGQRKREEHTRKEQRGEMRSAGKRKAAKNRSWKGKKKAELKEVDGNGSRRARIPTRWQRAKGLRKGEAANLGEARRGKVKRGESKKSDRIKSKRIEANWDETNWWY